MNRFLLFLLGTCLMSGSSVATGFDGNPVETGAALEARFRKLDKDSHWREVATHAIGFRTFHPQGMTAVGDSFFLSSVEVVDRKADKGVGHLFEMSRTGEFRREITLGEGGMYHPGGIDYDGRQIWVPVAAYHPDSSSIVYTVDPKTFLFREAFRFKDHLGALSHFPEKNLLVGVSWGSRCFYRWKTVKSGEDWTASDPEHPEIFPNGGHYIDYQDMERVPGTPYMSCGGLQTYTTTGGKFPSLKLGGIDMVHVDELRAHHQAPVPLRKPADPAWTQNPFYMEPSETGLRFFFVPEDEKSSIHVFEVDTEGGAAAPASGPASP